MLNFIWFLCCLVGVVINTQQWNYEDKGPDYWGKSYAKCSSGLTQSPINIPLNALVDDDKLKSFKFVNYNKDLNWTVVNTGETIRADLAQTDVTISGSNLNEIYNLKQFHLHWGYNEFHGSEHTIDSKKFPMEIHLVHQSAAGNYAVLGLMFVTGTTDNPSLNSLLKLVHSLDTANMTALLVSKLIEGFLPNLSVKSDYFRYMGSLTTPPCSEGIVWTIFKENIVISTAQLATLRTNEIKHNFRDIQPLNGRIIRKSCINVPCVSSGNRDQVKSFMLLTLVVVVAGSI